MSKKRKLKKGIVLKIFISLIVLAALILVGLFLLKKIMTPKIKEYNKSLNYMDTVIDIKLYSDNEEDAQIIMSEIERIYKYYHELTDRYNAYEGINNIYTINSTTEIKKLELNKDLYNILDYSKTWYNKSNGLFNVNIGSLTNLWKTYRDNKSGMPSVVELNSISALDINHIVLYDDYTILTGNVNIDLGGIAKGYATEVVHHYLDSINMENYLINAGGTVLAGKNIDTETFTVGIQDPDNAASIMKDGDKEIKLKISNAIITSSGGYERFYEFEGVKYHHIIDSKTKMPANYMKSVSVITDDAMLGDVLSTTLFLMSIEDGQEYIKQFDNVEAIWYSNDNQVIKSDGISKYE